jgi:hypothetical protein
MENFSTPITSISIEPDQKETISLSFPSPYSFQFSSHNLTIYISQNNFGDIINGQSLTVPQTEAYLQIVRYSPVETDYNTYHEYFNSTLNAYRYVNDNPNFCQRYRNYSWEVYTDTYHLASHMNVLDETYFNVTVFNNNTFPVNSVTLLGQIPSRGTYMNDWRALIDYVMQPNETYLFPVAEDELPYYAYVTGYLTNTTQPPPSSPTPIVTAIQKPEFPNQLLIIVLSVLVVVIVVSVLIYRRHRKTNNKTLDLFPSKCMPYPWVIYE